MGRSGGADGARCMWPWTRRPRHPRRQVHFKSRRQQPRASRVAGSNSGGRADRGEQNAWCRQIVGYHQIKAEIVRCLARCDLRPHWRAVRVDEEVDLGREATPRTAETRSRVPFLSPPLMMCAYHCAVDHLQCVRHGTAPVQCVNDVLPEPGQCPAPELPVNTRPLAELIGQVPPWGSGSGDPENPIENKAVLIGLRPFEARTAQMNGSKNAHSSSNIMSRPKLVSIAVASLSTLAARRESRLSIRPKK